MKRLITFLAFLLLVSLQIDAQQWSASRVGITLGGDIEMPHNLDHKYLLSTADNVGFDASELPFTEGELTSMECDNGTFRVNLSFMPTGSSNTELQFSLLTIDGRIDKVRYELEEEGHFAEVSAINEEVALEGVFLKRDQTTRSISLSGGIGTNIGYSYGGKVNVKGFFLNDAISDNPVTAEEIDITFDQKNSINQRIFIQAGIGFKILKKMEIGMDLRKGIGYRGSFGGPFKVTTLKRSIGLNLKYSL